LEVSVNTSSTTRAAYDALLSAMNLVSTAHSPLQSTPELLMLWSFSLQSNPVLLCGMVLLIPSPRLFPCSHPPFLSQIPVSAHHIPSQHRYISGFIPLLGCAFLRYSNSLAANSQTPVRSRGAGPSSTKTPSTYRSFNTSLFDDLAPTPTPNHAISHFLLWNLSVESDSGLSCAIVSLILRWGFDSLSLFSFADSKM